MHELRRANDRVDRAGVAAMKTAYARSLVNDGNGGIDSLLQRDDVSPKQAGQP
jgi:hypothetical protein